MFEWNKISFEKFAAAHQLRDKTNPQKTNCTLPNLLR